MAAAEQRPLPADRSRSRPRHRLGSWAWGEASWGHTAGGTGRRSSEAARRGAAELGEVRPRRRVGAGPPSWESWGPGKAEGKSERGVRWCPGMWNVGSPSALNTSEEGKVPLRGFFLLLTYLVVAWRSRFGFLRCTLRCPDCGGLSWYSALRSGVC